LYILILTNYNLNVNLGKPLQEKFYLPLVFEVLPAVFRKAGAFLPDGLFFSISYLEFFSESANLSLHYEIS
jgi:hypothetical protein